MCTPLLYSSPPLPSESGRVPLSDVRFLSDVFFISDGFPWDIFCVFIIVFLKLLPPAITCLCFFVSLCFWFPTANIRNACVLRPRDDDDSDDEV